MDLLPSERLCLMMIWMMWRQVNGRNMSDAYDSMISHIAFNIVFDKYHSFIKVATQIHMKIFSTVVSLFQNIE